MGRRNPGVGAAVINILTFFFLLGTIAVAAYFLAIFVNPQSALNPFPPIIIPTIEPTPTATPTPIRLPPTFTPQATQTPAATNTPRPTSTDVPTSTPFSLVPTATPDLSPTPVPNYPYAADEGNPLAIQSVIVHGNLGCAWAGVGGQVYNASGAPVPSLVVRLGGELNGAPVDELTLTGLAAQFGYGPSGYEFQLADAPFESDGELYVQLLSQDAGTPLSDRVYFDTFNDCDRNLVLVNFVEQD